MTDVDKQAIEKLDYTERVVRALMIACALSKKEENPYAYLRIKFKEIVEQDMQAHSVRCASLHQTT